MQLCQSNGLSMQTGFTMSHFLFIHTGLIIFATARGNNSNLEINNSHRIVHVHFWQRSELSTVQVQIQIMTHFRYEDFWAGPWKVGWWIVVHKTFLELSKQNSIAAFSKTTEGNGDLFLNVTRKKNIQLVRHNTSLRPRDPKLIWKDVIYTFFFLPKLLSL